MARSRDARSAPATCHACQLLCRDDKRGRPAPASWRRLCDECTDNFILQPLSIPAERVRLCPEDVGTWSAPRDVYQMWDTLLGVTVPARKCGMGPEGKTAAGKTRVAVVFQNAADAATIDRLLGERAEKPAAAFPMRYCTAIKSFCPGTCFTSVRDKRFCVTHCKPPSAAHNTTKTPTAPAVAVAAVAAAASGAAVKRAAPPAKSADAAPAKKAKAKESIMGGLFDDVLDHFGAGDEIDGGIMGIRSLDTGEIMEVDGLDEICQPLDVVSGRGPSPDALALSDTASTSSSPGSPSYRGGEGTPRKPHPADPGAPAAAPPPMPAAAWPAGAGVLGGAMLGGGLMDSLGAMLGDGIDGGMGPIGLSAPVTDFWASPASLNATQTGFLPGEVAPPGAKKPKQPKQPKAAGATKPAKQAGPKGAQRIQLPSGPNMLPGPPIKSATTMKSKVVWKTTVTW